MKATHGRLLNRAKLVGFLTIEDAKDVLGVGADRVLDELVSLGCLAPEDSIGRYFFRKSSPYRPVVSSDKNQTSIF